MGQGSSSQSSLSSSRSPINQPNPDVIDVEDPENEHQQQLRQPLSQAAHAHPASDDEEARRASEEAQQLERDAALARAVEANFGFGSFWQGARDPPPALSEAAQQNVARAAEHAEVPLQFPPIPREVSLQTLLSDGLRADLAFVPFQLPRTTLHPAFHPIDDDDEEREEREEVEDRREKPTIRCTNPFFVNKERIVVAPAVTSNSDNAVKEEQPAPPPRQSRSTGPPLPPKPSSSSSSAAAASTPYSIRFPFECMQPARVAVHWMCNEVEDEKLANAPPRVRFVPNPSVLAAANSAAASAVAAAPTPTAAAVSSSVSSTQIFPPGEHEYVLPPECAVNLQALSDLQLQHSHRLRYYPFIIHISEVEKKEDNESGPVIGSTPRAAVTSSAPRITSFTLYGSFTRLSNRSVSHKIVRSVVRVAPKGRAYELQEIFGLKGDTAAEGEEKRPATSPVSSPTGSDSASSSSTLSAAECVVCMCEARDTTIFPCRHFCLCHECARILKRQPRDKMRCPVCRATITHTIRIDVNAPNRVQPTIASLRA